MLEEQNLKFTDILLGYASKEVVDDEISHLGGYPTWLDDVPPPDSDWIRCANCKDFMSLILQLDAALPKLFPHRRRRLHIFMCKREDCRRKANSYCTIRSTNFTDASTKSHLAAVRHPQRNAQALETPARPDVPDLGASLFKTRAALTAASTGNPFRTNTERDYEKQNLLIDRQLEQDGSDQRLEISDLKRLCLSTSAPNPDAHKRASWPETSDLPKAWPDFFLDADYECIEQDSRPTESHQIIDENVSHDLDQEEGYESNVDKTFQAFADRIAQNPEQAIRYRFAGPPVLYSSTDEIGRKIKPHLKRFEKTQPERWHSLPTGLPNCETCESPRVFEVQIMPHTISELEGDSMNLDGMDWGTVIIGVCKANCSSDANRVGEVAFSIEWMGIQWEEIRKGA